MADKLKINEIFFSLQGEAAHVGLPMVFVRLARCNLRCSYCDTEYAFHEWTEMDMDEVIERVAAHPVRRVEITGGEPLLEPMAPQLMEALLARGYEVLLETGGSIGLTAVPPEVIKIMDIKTPSSGESHRLHAPNLAMLRPGRDQIKFVVGDRADFEWSLTRIREDRLDERALLVFQPVEGRLEAGRLAEWLLQAGVDARLSIQLHKRLWPERVRGV